MRISELTAKKNVMRAGPEKKRRKSGFRYRRRSSKSATFSPFTG